MAKDTTANWQVVNVDTLPTDIRDAYDFYKEEYKAMKEARDVFEAALRKALADHTPKGKRIAIAYNFGKLSVAVVDDNAKPAASSKAVSLADIIKR